MRLARVIGQCWGAKQASSHTGEKLLRLEILGAQLEPTGAEVIAIDRLGAGPRELVLFAHGSRCRDLTLGEAAATKEIVVAIVDDLQINEVAR